jgi:hypothetical protein
MAQEEGYGDRRGGDEDRGGEEKSEYERRGEERSDYERGDENKVGQDDDGHLVVQVRLRCLLLCGLCGLCGLCVLCVLAPDLPPQVLLGRADKGAACRRLTSACLALTRLS